MKLTEILAYIGLGIVLVLLAVHVISVLHQDMLKILGGF